MGYSQMWPVSAGNCRAEPCHLHQPFTTLRSKAGSQDVFQGRGTMVVAARQNMKKMRLLERWAAFDHTVLEKKAGSFGPDQPFKLLSSLLLGKHFSKLTPESTALAKGQTGRRLPICSFLLQQMAAPAVWSAHEKKCLGLSQPWTQRTQLDKLIFQVCFSTLLLGALPPPASHLPNHRFRMDWQVPKLFPGSHR